MSNTPITLPKPTRTASGTKTEQPKESPPTNPILDASGQTKAVPLLGQFLVERNIISRDCLEVALVEQKQALSARPDSTYSIEWALGEIIAQLNVCPVGALREGLGEYLGLPTIDLSALSAVEADDANGQALARALMLMRNHNISAESMMQCRFLPFALEDDNLSVAMSYPQDLDLLDSLSDKLPASIRVTTFLALSGEIGSTINRLGLRRNDPGQQVAQLGERLERSIDANQQHQILVTLIDKLLEAALCDQASDIHFAPSEKTLRILFRIDGVLQTRYRIHLRYASAVSVRIKVLANLDISESRLPQDGSCKYNINGMECDLRISTQPTQYGESVVMRLHGRDLRRCEIEKSGLPPKTITHIRSLLQRPHGLLLIAGPTGSGKSSTLYAMVKSLNLSEKNVVTLEDPIEYSLGESIRQTGINEAIGLSFSVALRATLRQDPDVVVIGEIRDKDSAQMSLRMAITGHLVLSTIHCDSALSVHQRLRLLGLKPELFADQLIACFSQRLARVACTHCCFLRASTAADGLSSDSNALDAKARVLDVRGCEHCDHTGYQGRRPILEVLEVSPDIAELIAGGASRYQLRALAEQSRFVSLRAQAQQAVREQTLTPAEAIRVAG